MEFTSRATRRSSSTPWSGGRSPRRRAPTLAQRSPRRMYADEICRMMVWSRGTAPASHDDAEHGSDPLTREWLVTNGLGGYASGTISGAVTRRFHGLLISALPAPLGRTMMLSDLSARVLTSEDRVYPVGGQEPWLDDGAAQVIDLADLRLEAGLPVWRYERAWMPIGR